MTRLEIDCECAMGPQNLAYKASKSLRHPCSGISLSSSLPKGWRLGNSCAIAQSDLYVQIPCTRGGMALNRSAIIAQICTFQVYTYLYNLIKNVSSLDVSCV